MKRSRKGLRRRYGKTRASIGRGWRSVQPHHKYAIVGLVPKLGGGYLKKRHVVGTARDAHEALVELIRVGEYNHGASGQGRWHHVVLDLSSGKGNLAPIVSEATLRERAARGQ